MQLWKNSIRFCSPSRRQTVSLQRFKRTHERNSHNGSPRSVFCCAPALLLGSLWLVVGFSGCGRSPHPVAKSAVNEKTEPNQSDKSDPQQQPALKKAETPFSLQIPPDATEIELDQKVSDGDLKAISKSQQLETLILDGGGVEPDQIKELLSLKSLEHLRIRNCAIDDEGVRLLMQLKKLRIFNFPQAQFSNASIDELLRLPDLQLLRFSSPHVDDRGIQKLSNSKSLRALHLIRVKVTDRSVEALCAIKSLESLYLDGCQLTDDGYSKIIKLRPDIHLHVDQVHLDYDPNKHEHRSTK